MESFSTKLPSYNRQDYLNAWLVLNRLSRGKIAQKLGISHQMVGQILSGKKIPQNRIDQMIEMGIPAELLPKKGNGGGNE